LTSKEHQLDTDADGDIDGLESPLIRHPARKRIRPSVFSLLSAPATVIL